MRDDLIKEIKEELVRQKIKKFAIYLKRVEKGQREVDWVDIETDDDSSSDFDPDSEDESNSSDDSD